MSLIFCSLIAAAILLSMFLWAVACDRICKQRSFSRHRLNKATNGKRE
jgi:hypothetical protein